MLAKKKKITDQPHKKIQVDVNLKNPSRHQQKNRPHQCQPKKPNRCQQKKNASNDFSFKIALSQKLPWSMSTETNPNNVSQKIVSVDVNHQTS